MPMDFLRRKDTVRKLETSPHLVSSSRVAHVESSEGSWFYLLSVLRVFVQGSIFLHWSLHCIVEPRNRWGVEVRALTSIAISIAQLGSFQFDKRNWIHSSWCCDADVDLTVTFRRSLCRCDLLCSSDRVRLLPGSSAIREVLDSWFVQWDSQQTNPANVSTSYLKLVAFDRPRFWWCSSHSSLSSRQSRQLVVSERVECWGSFKSWTSYTHSIINNIDAHTIAAS